MAPKASHTHTLQDVLRNAAAEIARLSTTIASVEKALEGGSTYTAGTDRAVLQNLDLAMQTIQNLTSFLNRVCDDVSPETPVNIEPALAKVHLQAVRDRLARYPGKTNSDHDMPKPDDTEHYTPNGLPEMF